MMIINKIRDDEARKWTQRRRKIESSHPKMRPSVGRDGEKVEGEAERKNLSFIYLIKAKPRRQNLDREFKLTYESRLLSF